MRTSSWCYSWTQTPVLQISQRDVHILTLSCCVSRRAAVLRGEAKDLDEIAYIYMKMGKFQRAEEMYRAVIAVQDSPLAHFALAAALRAGGHNRTGVFQEMEAGLERDPQNTDMRTRMGQWRQYEGTSDGLIAAMDAYEKVLEIDSEHILARFLLAQVLYNVGNLRRSVEEYEGVLERHPMHCESFEPNFELIFSRLSVTQENTSLWSSALDLI
jgi:tetratricopeptide (TPR) repeat protein